MNEAVSLREKAFARLITYILHPVILPLYLLVWLILSPFYFSMILTTGIKALLAAMVAITSFFFPSLFIYLLYRNGIIGSLYLEKREERIYPFITTAVFFFLTYYLFMHLQVLRVFQLFMLGATLLILICLFISLFWKISIHMAGIGGVFGTLIGISYRLSEPILAAFMVVLLLAGLVGFARLKLAAHEPAEVYGGFITGTFVMALIYLV